MLTFLLSITEEDNKSKTEHIYKTYHDDMIRFARYRLRIAGCVNYEIDAEDAVQNAFVKIIKYISVINFDAPEKAIKSYIFSIVANEANTIISECAFDKSIDDCTELVSDEDFWDEIDLKLYYTEVVEEIKRMDERYSIPLYLHYCREMSGKEISALLGIPEKSVYTRLSRGRKLLLEIISEEGTPL